MTSIDTRRRQLEAREADLAARLHRTETELESHNGVPDWEDSAIEHEGDEVLEGLGRADLRELERIRAALVRIDAGEYGICVRCGAAIAEERLDLLPDTPFCRDCTP